MNVKLLLFTVFLVALLIPQVYAQNENDDTINLLEIPDHLATALGIPLFASQLLTCSLVMLIVLLPIAIFAKRNTILTLIIGFTLMGFFIAIGWMPFWFLLVIALLIASLWSAKIKGWIS